MTKTHYIATINGTQQSFEASVTIRQLQKTVEELKAECDTLKACCVEFVRKVECGEAKSTARYNQMRQALALKEANHE